MPIQKLSGLKQMLVSTICLLSLSWLLIPLFPLKRATIAAANPILNDAYHYQDDFDDETGLDLTATQGFFNTNGGLQATTTTATMVSKCITLNQPQGGTFAGWQFADLYLLDLSDVLSTTLYIQDCNNTTLKTFNNLNEGGNSFDLSDLDPVADASLQVKLVITHTAQPGGGVIPAKVDQLGLYGEATGITTITMTTVQTTVNVGETVAFNIQVSSNGAVTHNPILRFSLDDINGLHTPDVDDGLAEDAEVDYGSGVTVYRPLEFISATGGPSGEIPSTPPVYSTTGEIVWQLNDLPDGFTDNVAVTLLLPKGYIDGKDFAARVTLSYGNIAADGVLNNFMQAQVTSSVVTATAENTSYLATVRNVETVGPGATNISEQYAVFQSFSTTPSDIEDLTLTLVGNGDCTPLFRAVDVVNRNENDPYQFLNVPAVGTPITITNPIIIHFNRLSYYAASIGTVYLYYDVPADCPIGSQIGLQGEVVGTRPAWQDTATYLYQVTLEVCRSGTNYVHRVMSGYDVSDFNPWPAWPEYYINEGSIRAGEFFTTWAPYGANNNRTHTIFLDHSYDLIDIPSGITFHGVRGSNWLSRLYKDCSGTAPLPTDSNFDHNNNPPHSAWKPVERFWSGQPFNLAPDENNPSAIVPQDCRLLAVKDADNPFWVGPDYGEWLSTFVWRMCDGSYGCTEPANGPLSLVPGTLYTYETVTDPAGIAHTCNMYGGWTMYKEAKSWPKVHSFSQNNQALVGDTVTINLVSENLNFASQYVDGHWGINLFYVRDAIDLNGLTGDILLTSDLNIPAPDQNVSGESCDLNQVIFHLPDPNQCQLATTASNPACLAWWEVPPACQPPNGWGYPMLFNWDYDQYIPIYQFQLHAPVKYTTPGETDLDFVAEVRTTDLSILGADNASNRNVSENYQMTTTLTSQEVPGFNISKTGPATWPFDAEFTYNLSLENKGNAPNDGLYLIDWLPRNGVNGNEFTPDYGQVFLNYPPTEVMLEVTTDNGCQTTPFTTTWTALSLQPSNRPGYQSETTATITYLQPEATCLRVRRHPSTTLHLNPGDSLSAGINIIIPNDPTLVDKTLFGRAFGGASQSFGATTDMSLLETVNVPTIIRSEVTLVLQKSFEIDKTRAGWVKWSIKVHNNSGVAAENITVLDILSNTLMYEGAITTTTEAWQCFYPNCVADGVNPNGTGGTVRFIIPQLAPDDGNPGSGNDETTITFWSRVIPNATPATSIENCAQVIVNQTTLAEDCSSTTVPNITISKSQLINGVFEPDIPDIYHGDTIHYAITITNQMSQAVFAIIHDTLPSQVDYISGTFKVNGATASDIFIQNNQLIYTSTTTLAPSEMLMVEFAVTVHLTDTTTHLLKNVALSTLCGDLLSPESCYPTQESNATWALASCPAGADCANTTVPQPHIIISKGQMINGIFQPGIPNINHGDTIHYAITVTNQMSQAVFAIIYDMLPPQVDYISGTFKVNGTPESDSFIQDNQLVYTHPITLAPTEMLMVEFAVTVHLTDTTTHLLKNIAMATLCGDLLDLESCHPNEESNPTWALAACSIGAILKFFNGTLNDNIITLNWATVNEPETQGFHVWRSLSEMENYTRLTTDLIAGNGTLGLGGNYTYDDINVTPEETYYYQLELINTQGISTFYGPIAVTVPAIVDILQWYIYLPLVLR